MQTVIQHESGLVFSVKTFRPLWVFPWLSSVWRQFPLRTCIATVSYDSKAAAATGHKELSAMLEVLQVSKKMSEPFAAIEAFARERLGAGVKSYRIYSGHALDGKVSVTVTPERTS